MEVTIDALGRILIPKKIRERLGLVPNSKLDLRVEDGAVRLEPKEGKIELIKTESGLVMIRGIAPISAEEVRKQKIEQYERKFDRT